MTQPIATMLPGQTPGIEIENGYDLRADLKARGYRFDGDRAVWTITGLDRKATYAEAVRLADASVEIRLPRGSFSLDKARAALAAMA